MLINVGLSAINNLFLKKKICYQFTKQLIK